MKKDILKRFAGVVSLLLAVAFFAACDEEGMVVENEPAIKIISNNLLFGPQGGVGTIEFEAAGAVSAYSEQSWCSVNVQGNVVSVTVNEYAELENRYSSIILECEDTSVRVVAQQNGVIMQVEGNDNYILDDNAHELSFKVTSNCKVTVSSEDAWISCANNDNEIVVNILQNETGHIRSGSFTYACGNVSKTVTVSQASAADLYGDYRLLGYSSNNQLTYLPAVISEGEQENELLITCTGNEFSWCFNGTFEPQTHEVVFGNAQYAGEYTMSGYNFYIYLCMLSKASGSFTWDSALSSRAKVVYNTEKQATVMEIEPYSVTASSGTTSYDSWVFAAFMKKDAATGGPSGNPSAYPAILYTPYFMSY